MADNPKMRTNLCVIKTYGYAAISNGFRNVFAFRYAHFLLLYALNNS